MKIALIAISVLLLGGVAWVFVNSLAMQNKAVTQSTQKHNLHAASVTDEKAFIHGMVPHHEEAITSSQELLEVATTPEVRELAENIIIAQKKEVAEMKRWYKNWFKQEYKNDGKYKPMMPSLAGKSAEEAEQAYLKGMIGHHEHAVTMANAILTKTDRQELKTMGGNIIKTQNEEITQMKKMVNSENAEMMEHSSH